MRTGAEDKVDSSADSGGSWVVGGRTRGCEDGQGGKSAGCSNSLDNVRS
jgi:hypothetical protein